MFTKVSPSSTRISPSPRIGVLHRVGQEFGEDEAEVYPAIRVDAEFGRRHEEAQPREGGEDGGGEDDRVLSLRDEAVARKRGGLLDRRAIGSRMEEQDRKVAPAHDLGRVEARGPVDLEARGLQLPRLPRPRSAVIPLL